MRGGGGWQGRVRAAGSALCALLERLNFDETVIKEIAEMRLL